MRRGVAAALAFALVVLTGSAHAQSPEDSIDDPAEPDVVAAPDDADDASGSAAPDAADSASGSAAPDDADSASGSAAPDDADSASGSAAPDDPNSASGADPSTGSGSAAGSGAGSGSASPPVIIIPTDVTPPEVSAAASPSRLRLGERFTLFVTAVYSPDGDVNLREPVELGSAFEVVRKRVAADKVRPDGKKEREWQLEVYAWDVGDLRIPPIAVTFTSQGKAGQVITNVVPLEVTGVLGDVVDDPKLMRDNTPPVSLLSRDWFLLWVAGGVAALIGVALLALYIRNRRRRRVRTLIGTLAPTGPAPRRIDMTSERALEQLLAIERSGVLDRDDDRKQGYAEMVRVIREYLGARYRVATLDLTTYELLRRLAPVAPEGERMLVERWLERCDIVKYGGLRATAADARGVLEGARQLVIVTTRVGDAPPRGDAAEPAPAASEPSSERAP